jgi:hypothetical protein
MTSTIKVDNIQDQDGNNIINENSNTITIGASGDTVTLASGASQTGFGRTGTVDWQTSIKTSTITAVNGEGYFVNTTGGAITANLPAGSAGAIVAFRDYANTFDNNNLTISSNGSEKINGGTLDLTVSTEGESLTLVYADATKGWLVVNDGNNDAGTQASFIVATGGTITTDGNFKVHTFSGPGTFTVCSVGNAAGSTEVSYLVVAGGGSGGAANNNNNGTGGGGAGGFREGKTPQCTYTASPLACTSGSNNGLPVSAQGYPITVGAGASAPPSPTNPGSAGSNSIFSTITSAGGGFGGDDQDSGGNGGSGGGSGANNPGGTGNTPPVSPAQGSNGGSGFACSGPSYGGGGGGGATAVGGNGAGPAAGNGGAGATSSINGSPAARAGGGGGGAYSSGTAGDGGAGGGGDGANGSEAVGNGSTNTGGGGGGSNVPASGSGVSGAGGSGIVIIRYKFQ